MRATTLHQIEVTSRCNLRCRYCLQSVLTRPRQDISEPDFAAALDWVRFYLDAGTQGEVVMTGTGESLLHPRFVEYCARVREVLGPSRRILLTTNGLLVTDELIAVLQPLNVRCYVSLHKPEQATRAVHALGFAGLLEGVSIDPVSNSNSWAGQVDWPDVLIKTEESQACPWLQAGWLYVGSNGGLYPCCYANGDMPVYGHVTDTPRPVQVAPTRICQACWMRQPWPDEYGKPVRLIR